MPKSTRVERGRISHKFLILNGGSVSNGLSSKKYKTAPCSFYWTSLFDTPKEMMSCGVIICAGTSTHCFLFAICQSAEIFEEESMSYAPLFNIRTFSFVRVRLPIRVVGVEAPRVPTTTTKGS